MDKLEEIRVILEKVRDEQDYDFILDDIGDCCAQVSRKLLSKEILEILNRE